MSSVQVIGGGLYGCLTAYHIAKKRPDLRVDLIEAGDHLLSAFDPVTLAGIKFNNGFHGLELPRSQALFDFIRNDLGVQMEKRPNQRGLAIKNHLIPFEARRADWPESFRPFFVKAPGETQPGSGMDSYISNEYLSFLKTIGKRYSDATEEIEGLLYPWFFPADYEASTNDEGDLFRNSVRRGNVVASYGHPPKDLFNVLQSKMEEKLNTVNVNIHFSTKIKFTQMGMAYEEESPGKKMPKPEQSIIFYCASLAIMLKGIDPGLFGQLLEAKRLFLNGILAYSPKGAEASFGYSEILVADELIPSLARISFPSKAISLNGKRVIQCELFIEPDSDWQSLRQDLPEHVSRILGLKGDQRAELLDLQVTRTVFFPPARVQQKAVELLKGWSDSRLSHFRLRTNFAPINMAKTWIYAIENAAHL